MQFLLSFALLLGLHAQAAESPGTINVEQDKPASVFSIASGLTLSDAYTIESPVHFVHDINPVVSEDYVRAVIEIPTGSVQKWEVDKADGNLKWEFKGGAPRVVKFLGFPGNYGMVPRTLLAEHSDGDGDPMDVLIIGQAVPRGSVVTTRIIGMLNMTDKGKQDDKLIGVLPDGTFDEIYTIKQLDKEFPGASSIVKLWFENYKGQKKITATGYSGRKSARKALARALEDYKSHSNE